MRLSDQSRTHNQVRYLADATERADRVQRQLSTNRRIDRASDDPTGAALAMQHRKNISFEAQMRRNLENGTAFLNVTESALNSTTELLQRARELTVQGATGTLGPSEKVSIATEVNQIIQQLAQVANTNFGGAYIFSGHQTQTAAYQVSGNPPVAVTWQGDAGQRIRQVSAQDAVAVNVIGDQVFGDMFTDLIALRDNLNSNAATTTINGSIADIDQALNSVLNSRADVGARLNRFESTTNRSLDTDTNLQELRASIEDIDISETIIQFTAAQNALEAALGAIGKTANMTLLNYL
ncbi:MAG: flagellar hook-associated protein FlgL [Dehalococcoidia bacterium]|jgi:flagellar hook-associated protein 3 FlgL|uniref:flagellar hook-associated protein FlgL n=1 Tax=Candidatus Amarobacter glycogenicus TaxID=3140699 RepID=UPI001DB4B902|nr:flagellar hook-associated protein FlgL [Dehalococcoidia bacterium]MBK7125900.1 flagellar hook-associated protein FlgL [Dehalococcoidia bacterium]MBK7328443.1 flagellar hook-associated protein FlgL [Dehalococcoidia bacterium]MBK7726098.1 flagellar hook-associated protein FlgL [Dehalococcoidia bacterium]MBK8559479.1 flagellar hook-associated protein FlgL [Dehalococcoidia bacterium]